MKKESDKSGIERQIDETLREIYKVRSEEAVPDRFVNLLKQLKEQESKNEQ